MTPGGAPVERLAFLARTIKDLAWLAHQLEPDQASSALTAIEVLAVEIHDQLDAKCRARGGGGIGYLCPLRAALDDAARAARLTAAA